MSAYIDRHCIQHGSWSMDVDNPSETCPQCPSNDDIIKAKDAEISRLQNLLDERDLEMTNAASLDSSDCKNHMREIARLQALNKDWNDAAMIANEMLAVQKDEIARLNEHVVLDHKVIKDQTERIYRLRAALEELLNPPCTFVTKEEACAALEATK